MNGTPRVPSDGAASSLSIVLPCYNPSKEWEKRVVESVREIASDTNLKEVIIVNDGSEIDIDTAVNFIRENCSCGLTYISYPENRGKGFAIRRGLASANSEIVIYTDIDFPYTHASLVEIYDALVQTENKIIVGVKSQHYYEHVPFERRVISKALRSMIALLLRMNITDTQCGLKGMRQEAKWIWQEGTIDRYLFDLEAIYNATRKEIKMKALPVTLREGVIFSAIPLKLLLRELNDFLGIITQLSKKRNTK